MELLEDESRVRHTTTSFNSRLQWRGGTTNPAVGDCAARVIERMGEPVVVPLSAALVQQEHDAARARTIRVLEKIGDRRAIPAIREVLRAPPIEAGQAQGAAVHALGKLGDQAALPLIIESLNNSPNQAASAIGDLGGDAAAVEPILEQMEQMARRKDKSARTSLALALKKAARKESLPALERALDHEEPFIREAAAGAIAGLKSPAAAPLLRKALASHRDPRVRVMAAGGLVALRDVSSVDALKNALKVDADEKVRCTSANGILACEDLTGVEVLEEAARTDPSKRVRDIAARSAKELRRIAERAKRNR